MWRRSAFGRSAAGSTPVATTRGASLLPEPPAAASPLRDAGNLRSERRSRAESPPAHAARRRRRMHMCRPAIGVKLSSGGGLRPTSEWAGPTSPPLRALRRSGGRKRLAASTDGRHRRGISRRTQAASGACGIAVAPFRGHRLAKLLEEHDEGDSLRTVAEAVLLLFMEPDLEGMIGAGRRERAEGRTTWRNGCRDRALDTRLGTLNLRVPKLRSNVRASPTAATSSRPATRAGGSRPAPECGTPAGPSRLRHLEYPPPHAGCPRDR